MQMRSARSAETGDKNITGSTKRHIISRLHKANVYAARLVTLLEDQQISKASPNAILEARAYQVSLCGAVAFERQHWQACLRYYSEARLIYASLAEAQGSRDDDLFRDLLSSTVDPSIRFAAYQFKVPRTTSIESIAKKYAISHDNMYLKDLLKANSEKSNEQTPIKEVSLSGDVIDVPKSIQWRSRTVKIEDAATAQALASVMAAEKKLALTLSSDDQAPLKVKAAAYDEILIFSQDAVDSTKTAIDELTADGIPQSDARMQSLQMTRTAVNYALVGWRAGRNRVLCGEQDGASLQPLKPKIHHTTKASNDSQSAPEESSGHRLKRLRERVVLYDATLQSLESVNALPGVAADQPFVDELDGKRSYFQSLRSLAIARSHRILGDTRNALALISRALEQCSKASKAASTSIDISSNKPPDLSISHGHINRLKTLLETLFLEYRALVEVQSLWEIAERPRNTLGGLTVERLDEYPVKLVDLTKLVAYPPKVVAIPVKPIFLDVAYNYIEYPGRADKREGKGAGTNGMLGSVVERRDEKKGWFGFGR